MRSLRIEAAGGWYCLACLVRQSLTSGIGTMRSAIRVRKCLILGVDRKSSTHLRNDVTDPGCVKTASMIRFSSDLAGGLDGAFCGWR